jgi:phosphoribosylglycinamide formyltransferase-1
MDKPKLLIFASGDKSGGGSGFANLIKDSRAGILKAEIVGVVSNHPKGGVFKIAQKYQIKFFYFPSPYAAQKYQEFVKKTKAQWVALSGWVKLAKGLKPNRTINIHPAPLPQIGGKNMYGLYVHQAVLAAFKQGKIAHSAVSMHFAAKKYDQGPIFFRYPVKIKKSDTPLALQKRVKKIERRWQGKIANLIVNQEISWDGKSRKIKTPQWYKKEIYCPKESI